MQIKICESCGMPMMSEEHYPLGKIDSKYCVHCTDEFGNLKSFEEKVIDITNLMVSKQNMTEDEAKKWR